MVQNWGVGPLGNQPINTPWTFASSPAFGSSPQVIQLLQVVPQQLQQLQQLEYARHQQLQQIQQLLQYIAYQFQSTGQHQGQQTFPGLFGSQGFVPPYQTMGAGATSAFATPPLHVM